MHANPQKRYVTHVVYECVELGQLPEPATQPQLKTHVHSATPTQQATLLNPYVFQLGAIFSNVHANTLGTAVP